MTRKTKIVTIEREGRDKGKRFLITEMPAAQGENWALRAFHAMAAAGVDIPEGHQDVPVAQMVTMGLKALSAVPFETLDPLLKEMLLCVQLVPSNAPERELLDSDIEEIFTFMQLRKEVLMLSLIHI